MRTAMEDLIVVKDLNKHFPGTHALKDVSLSFKKGEVHALVGANGAGKSTLMNILGGEYPASSGEIVYQGKTVTIPDPYTAIQMGISVVYQELKLCDNLTVTENIFLGHELRDKRGRLDWKAMEIKTGELLDKLKADIDPLIRVKFITVGKKQLVEIARALNLRAKVLILDEPTSALSMKDAEKLFQNVFDLKAQGVTVIFVSHRMEEVFKISDRITALRDGENLGTFEKTQVTPEEIVKIIAGKTLSEELNAAHRIKTWKEPVLEVKNLSRGECFKEISFTLHKGEFLGVYGLQGAGRTELLETLFGMEKADGGSIRLFNREIGTSRPSRIIDWGMIMVPEDRRGKGIISKMNITENINSVTPPGSLKAGFVQSRHWEKVSRKMADRLNVKYSRLGQKISSLSGGNQQKVIIAKWLTRNPKVLLLDEVTRGIDVGAKAEIFRILQGLREEGISVVMVSSELSEILAECDRTLVMWSGRIVADVDRANMNSATLMSYAMGVSDNKES